MQILLVHLKCEPIWNCIFDKKGRIKKTVLFDVSGVRRWHAFGKIGGDDLFIAFQFCKLKFYQRPIKHKCATSFTQYLYFVFKW